MRVVWTADAESDLDLIAYHIRVEDHSPQTARKVLQRIRDACELRSTQPESAAIRSELANDVRQFFVDGFVILYRAVGDEFQVLLVVRGARDVEAIYSERFPD